MKYEIGMLFVPNNKIKYHFMKIYFKETQKFNIGLTTLILAPIFVYLLFKILSLPYFGVSFILKQYFFELFFLLVISIVWFIVAIAKYEITVTENDLIIKFWPILSQGRVMPIETIKRAFVRKYNPILEYGGWGLPFMRFLGSYNNRALNTRGNVGVQLFLKDGRYLLLGSQKSIELESVLQSLIKSKAL